jgi:hypothetical protein
MSSSRGRSIFRALARSQNDPIEPHRPSPRKLFKGQRSPSPKGPQSPSSPSGLKRSSHALLSDPASWSFLADHRPKSADPYMSFSTTHHQHHQPAVERSPTPRHLERPQATTQPNFEDNFSPISSSSSSSHLPVLDTSAFSTSPETGFFSDFSESMTLTVPRPLAAEQSLPEPLRVLLNVDSSQLPPGADTLNSSSSPSPKGKLAVAFKMTPDNSCFEVLRLAMKRYEVRDLLVFAESPLVTLLTCRDYLKLTEDWREYSLFVSYNGKGQSIKPKLHYFPPVI